jgi:hypothetical protein
MTSQETHDKYHCNVYYREICVPAEQFNETYSFKHHTSVRITSIDIMKGDYIEIKVLTLGRHGFVGKIKTSFSKWNESVYKHFIERKLPRMDLNPIEFECSDNSCINIYQSMPVNRKITDSRIYFILIKTYSCIHQ